MYKENGKGPRTVPCRSPDMTGAQSHLDLQQLTTTLCQEHRRTLFILQFYH